jgi:hypothetical protein
MASNLNITFGSTPTTVTVPIPAALSGDAVAASRNIFLAGSFSYTDSTGALNVIPASQISKIVAS